ncbi:MAG TPA: DinB family protein [Thermoanaerobaculia bacterium]|nr:DinB family protein [Thermoanaerobaculia bacterium]
MNRDRRTPRSRERSSGEPVRPLSEALRESILNAWTTNDRTTIFLVERLPAAVLAAKIPGEPQKTVRMLAAHIHNARRMWLRTLGAPHGIAVPAAVDRRRVRPAELVRALKISGRAMSRLLELGLDHGGRIPPTKVYIWRNLPLDVGHVLSYFVAHEGHHRGQIVMLARQLGHRLPREVTYGLWQWSTRVREARERA